MCETYISCFGPDLNSCLLDAEAGILVVRFPWLSMFVMVLKCFKYGVNAQCIDGLIVVQSVQIKTYCVVIGCFLLCEVCRNVLALWL